MIQFIYDKEDIEMWAIELCKKAKKSNLACMYEKHDCPEFGYFDVYFMTDKFGGTFACLRLKRGIVQFTDYKTPFKKLEKISDSIEQFFKACINMNESRNLDEIYENVNAENDD